MGSCPFCGKGKTADQACRCFIPDVDSGAACCHTVLGSHDHGQYEECWQPVDSPAAASAPSTEVRDEPGAACKCFPANAECPSAVSCSASAEIMYPGHSGYLVLLEELGALHKVKSAGYGTGDDPMANFTAVADLADQPRYLYPVHRTIEKLTRVLSLHAQGRDGELEEEFLDGASLLLCAAAMLRDDRRTR